MCWESNVSTSSWDTGSVSLVSSSLVRLTWHVSSSLPKLTWHVPLLLSSFSWPYLHKSEYFFYWIKGKRRKTFDIGYHCARQPNYANIELDFTNSKKVLKKNSLRTFLVCVWIQVWVEIFIFMTSRLNIIYKLIIRNINMINIITVINTFTLQRLIIIL